MANTTQPSLILGVCNGDDKAWYKFYKNYTGLLYFVGRNDFNLKDDEISIVIHDVMVEFLKMDFTYNRDLGKFRNYLKRIFRNKAFKFIDNKRKAAGIKKKPKTPFSESEGENLYKKSEYKESAIDPENYLDEICHPENLAKILKKATEIIKDKMQPKTFQVFQYVKLEGRPPQDVADICKMTKNNVYAIKNRWSDELSKQALRILELEQSERDNG